MELAVERVRLRLELAVKTLVSAGVPCAVIGGHAVRAWVAQVDESAARVTTDVNLMINRSDLSTAINVLEKAGFFYQNLAGLILFVDHPQARSRDSVQLFFANEKVQSDHVLPTPDVTEVELVDDFPVLKLEALVRMKLTAYRDKDRMHLRDLIEVGLINAAWCANAPDPLRARLQALIDHPDG